MWRFRKSELNYHALEQLLTQRAEEIFGQPIPRINEELALAFHKAARELRGDTLGRKLFARQLTYGLNWVPVPFKDAGALSNGMIDRTLRYLSERATTDATEAEKSGAQDIKQTYVRMAYIADEIRTRLANRTAVPVRAKLQHT